MRELPVRYETDDDYRLVRPIHVVWEVTLACNLRCIHCGSRAGKVRPGELSTSECLDVIGQLARLGVRHVTLIGGEAFLRKDWVQLIAAIRSAGMLCSLQTGGRALTPQRLAPALDAGLTSCGVSIDGLAPLHDRLRGVEGSFDEAFDVLRYLKTRGVPSSVNTQITAETMPDLRELMHRIASAGVGHWQVQLTVAMGNAADHADLLLQPYQLLELMPLLAQLYEEASRLSLLMQPGNNIGYFGPYEHLWRVIDDDKGHWQGCAAGHTSIGIEANGTIKGCPSLPTEPYAGGNVREMSIEDIWQLSDALRFTRDRTTADLWGRCQTCYYADVCRGGCTWTSHVLFGRAGNNPFCHYRALELADEGLRERIRKVDDAPGRPFDHGRFELVTEPLDGSPGHSTIAVPPPVLALASGPRSSVGRVPPVLPLCHGCDEYVLPDTVDCPHCGSNVKDLEAQHRADVEEARQALAELQALLP